MVILTTINFPKDEEKTKNPKEYQYLDPVITPCLKVVFFPLVTFVVRSSI